MIKKPRSIGYLGIENLKRAGVTIDYTEEQIQELVKCSKDPLYFIEKYCKIISLDKGLIPFKMWDFQKDFINHLWKERKVISMMGRQQGKALALDTPVITPSGYRTVGELQVGDFVFGRDGRKTKITFITETMYNKKMYNVKFSNGETIVACEDHLWTVGRQKWKSHSSRPERTLSTKELLEKWPSYERYYVEATSPIEFDKKDVSIDPYTLGLWLGDGHSESGRITCHASDYEHYSKEVDCSEFKLDKRSDHTGYFTVYGLSSKLRKLGLIQNKHIPTEYLLNDVQSRLSLLQGLMDSDGTIMPDGSMKFYNTNDKIVEGVEFLLSSLGVKYTKAIRVGKIGGTEYKDCQVITFSAKQLKVVSLPRKLDRISNSSHPKSNRLYIESIVEVDTVPCRCLQVDNEDHLFLVGKTMIPTHNTTVVAAYITWHVIFNDQQNVALLSYKLAGAKEVLTRIKTMYENLPFFLQVGVKEWNKTSIELDNGSKVFAAATSANAVTGKSLNMVFLDEYAVVSNNIAEDFNTSVWPTLSTGETTKLVVVSTPRGRNHFYKLWKEAEQGINGFVNKFYSWDAVPGRDEKWLQAQRVALGELKFARDILCTFENSSNTLVSGSAISKLVVYKPVKHDETGTLRVFEEVKDNHVYISVVDVARGTENDYSTMVTVDVSVRPFKVVCTYRDNKISTEMLPDKVKGIAKYYNESFVLIETNDMGESVINNLYHELEYENVFKTSASTIEGWTKHDHLGLRTTVKTKRRGCEALKNLIESGQLEVSDAAIISELSTFVAKRNTYAAEVGSHDDLVMPLVLFGWLTLQLYFKDLIGIDRTNLLSGGLAKVNQELYVMGMQKDDPEPELTKEEIDVIPDDFKWMFDRKQQIEFLDELLEQVNGFDEDSLHIL